ncbi:MAG TPA: winged helix DNA-binding domain-containing protein [Solirubrobacteraceae bacterium]|nr:winged helix DNA-binding domain-containing protein [Solirubrobacteraceae bacterium]
MIAERLTAQLLAGAPARDPVVVAERLLAIQGQDPRGARLAVRARTTGLSAADVDRALSEERSLLITWVNRGTLHLLRSEDYPWLHALTTPQLLTSNARRLRQEGVEPSAAERAVQVIERALAGDGPLTREALKERIDAAGVRTAGQALVHILLLASLRGLIVRGPMIERRHAYVLVQDWLDKPKPVDGDRALAELARRYLRGHGPAEDRDLARWAGVTLRDARAGLSAIAPELQQREDGLVDLSKRAPAAKLAPPRLLGPFDPLLLGWRSREPLLGSHTNVVTSNGVFRPIALVRGRAVGIWSMRAGKVELEPFDELSSRDGAALRADAKDVQRYLAANSVAASSAAPPAPPRP